jgi:two-component system, response regulator
MDLVDILLIEDNHHDIEEIVDVLNEQNSGAKLIPLKDGVEAIDYFFGPQSSLHAATVKLPKLILLDLKLPKISGLEVLKRLKSDERTRHIPVVVLTSSSELSDRSESYLLGANSYIVKPLNADQFSQFASDIIFYWLKMNKTVYSEDQY